MPKRPLRPCSHYGCPNLTDERFCSAHKIEHKPFSQYDDKARPSAAKRGYDRKWWAARVAFLRSHPLCAICNKPAVVVDHVIPHRGDMGLFWNSGNWQALCDACHNRKTMKELH